MARKSASDVPPTLLAFAFSSEGPTPSYPITRVRWTQDAHDWVTDLADERWKAKEKKLPIKDLRLRVQLYDPGTVRVGYELGLGMRFGEREGRFLLFSQSDKETAEAAANRAIVQWTREALTKLGLSESEKAVVDRLQKLAIRGLAAEATLTTVPIFTWGKGSNGTAIPAKSYEATAFADLADYAAGLLVGQEVFDGKGILRREVGTDLSDGSARLLTEPMSVTLGRHQGSFSLGLTLRVATYPGRNLPVLVLEVRKQNWTGTPTKSYRGRGLSGLAFPSEQLGRAFKYTISNRLLLQEDYAALAAEYFLPAPAADFTATELGRDGASAQDFSRCPVWVQALPGRSKVKTAGTGVTDLDRLDVYSAVAKLLESVGFRQWGGSLRLVETHTTPLAGLGADWQAAFPLTTKRKKLSSLSPQEQKKKETDTSKKKKALYADWKARVQDGLAQYYNGQYHLLIAYQNGLVDDAKMARDTLKKAMGTQTVKFHLEELPPNVHLSNWNPNERQYRGRSAWPRERAERRQAAWQPWISRLQKKYNPDGKEPLDGALVIARKHYKHTDGSSGDDDPINKQVGRVELINGLNVLVQYLLPIAETEHPVTADEVAEFRLRTINAWGDLAWKSVGRMHSLSGRLPKSLPHVAAGDFSPVVLGMGIIRVNQKQQKGNSTSFIPYLVEVDTQTGECLATTLLHKREKSQPEEVIWLPLPQAVRRVAGHGPSYLGDTTNTLALVDGRKNQAGQFFFNQLRARAAHHHNRDVVILADMGTLGGVWPWLADKSLDGSGSSKISLPGGGSNLLTGLPHASLLRIRPDHAPKVVLAAEGLLASDGHETRPVGTWADAKLYHLTEAGASLPSYLSFGSRLMSEPRAQSCYRSITSLKGKDQQIFNRGIFTGTWATPVAVEITVVPNPDQPIPRYTPDELARLVEDLRASYDHFGGWTTLPGPLHFATVLKQYVPDYDLAEFEAEDEGGNELEDEEAPVE